MTPLSDALCDGGVAAILDRFESIDLTEFGAVTNDSAFAEQMRRSAMELVKDASLDGVSRLVRGGFERQGP